MLVLMYFGGLMFFDNGVNLITSQLRAQDGTPKDRVKLDTVIFHTFVLMNLFNQINCRVVDPNELNVFKTLLNNPYFWLITGIEVANQVVMLWLGNFNLTSVLLGTAPLTPGMNVAAWIFGAFSLVVNIGLKKIPMHLVEKIPWPDLETETAENNSKIAQINK